MKTTALVLPPIRAQTAKRNGEPQLKKKRLKMENLTPKEITEKFFFMEVQ